MKIQRLLPLPLLLFGCLLQAQRVQDFFYVEPTTKELPVFIRGNLSSKKILLFIQGGGAENGIDFGRSDYVNWKSTLEQKVAIAYFDQRGLNRKIKKIDTSKINQRQVLVDILTIAKQLNEKYESAVFLFGHSAGGSKVLDCLGQLPKESSFISGGIAISAPITTDFSTERYHYYRPLYLKNLAKEFIQNNKDTTYWREALNWMIEKDSIYDTAISRQWRKYANSAYLSVEKKITLTMVFKVIFSKPYNPIGYLNRKDNQLVADILWEQERNYNRWLLLPKIEQPLLLITGRFDPIAVVEEQIDGKKLISKAKLVVIPDSKHWPMLDQPKLFEDAILKFVEHF